MLTIVKARQADCDRGTDDNGNFTDGPYVYCVCEDWDENQAYEWFSTPKEAEKGLKEIFEEAAQSLAFDRSSENENDPLIFDGIEEDDEGNLEAHFHDSKARYCFDRDLEFGYACAR